MDELLNFILVETVKIALVGVVGLAVPLMVQLIRRAGLQVTAEQQNQLHVLASSAAAEVEEWAAAKIKANLVVTSADKMERAVAALIERSPKVTESEAKAAIQAALPQIGLGAAVRLKELEKRG